MPLLQSETTLFPDTLLTHEGLGSANEARWWVVHTRPRAEKTLARKLKSSGVAFFLPTRYQRWKSNGRWFESHVPLFPGYVFVYASPTERSTIFATGSVANLLHVADQEELLGDLQQIHRLLATGLPLEHQVSLPAGTSVEVVGGALQGLSGTVVRTGRQAAIFIQVRLIGQGVLVELDSRLLRPADQLIAV